MGGAGGGVTNTQGHTREGGVMRGKEGGMVRPLCSAAPCNQLRPDKRQDVREKSTFTQTHRRPAAGSDTQSALVVQVCAR